MPDVNLVCIDGVLVRAWPSREGMPWGGVIKSIDGERQYFILVKTFNKRADELRTNDHVRFTGKLNSRKTDKGSETYVFATMVEFGERSSERWENRSRDYSRTTDDKSPEFNGRSSDEIQY